ncbi:MAG: dihydrolipoamide acetyltransferase family protein [Actinomycetota bacterium]
MTVSVELPRMGENVTEGTIVRWLKAEGDWVDEDEPLVEISTDKIDTELPAPAAGVLKKIVAQEEQTIEVGAEIAVIDETANKEGGAAASEEKAPAADKEEDEEPKAQTEAPAAREAESEEEPEEEPQQPAASAASAGDGNGRRAQVGALSPLVRKLARENDVDLTEVKGTGQGGRITKADVMAFLEQRGAKPAKSGAIREQAPSKESAPAVSSFIVPAGESEEVPFTRIRRAIAEHMTRSIDTAAHVTNIVEVDMTRIAALRDRAKGDFKRREGFGLTFLPFVASAVIQALRAFPEFNAHLDPEYKTAKLMRGVNLGIAVGRDEGLIVPVVHGADGMNLLGLARGINDIATRARAKGGLKPDDVAGGTFTITNGGSFGTLIETPIINQPQAAIIGTGAVVKRPVVMTVDGSDAVAIRQMMYLYLSYDHRWVDGHKAAQFNARVRAILEEADFAHELGLEP